MYTIHSVLQSSHGQLKHLESASLDSEVLLSYVLNKPREYILSHGENEVPNNQAERFLTLISERARHKPVAYLIKRKEFYGRDFFVDERVHIPRPATEDLIDYIKEFVPRNFSGTMADIGTGSGCIAVTLALEYPNANIIATDISNDALVVASRNINTHIIKHGYTPLTHREAAPLRQRGIAVLQGDLLEPLEKPVDIIVSNPPYGWKEGWSDDKETKQQPPFSYESGTDGLDAIREIINKLPDYLKPSGQAFIEFDPRSLANIEQLLKTAPFAWEIKKDLAGWDRIARLNYK